jgi:hypothetical protein
MCGQTGSLRGTGSPAPRLQQDRKHQERVDSCRKLHEIEPDTSELASFGRTDPELVMTADSFRVLTNLPPHKPRVVPVDAEPMRA